MGYWTATDEEILEALDPDWKERFAYDSDRAAHFYRTFGRKAWDEAEAELNGEDDKRETDTFVRDAEEDE